ncbi:GtrA family protein [Bacillus sp. DJP31]|uniref:GtrA family protein n=1 Tax=Bacillus sp. DJP31 TaxID=3409789 RepID=UPI003BB6EDA3
MSLYILTLRDYLRQTNSFVRFLLVGVMNTLVGLSLILILMNAFEMNYWLSTFIGNGTGAVISYFLNRKFTFKSQRSHQRGAPAFFVVILICYFGSYSISAWMINMSNQPQEELAVLVGCAFYTLTNYCGQKIVFAE